MKQLKMVTIHLERSNKEGEYNEKMQKATAMFPQEKREFLWVRVFGIGLDDLLNAPQPAPGSGESKSSIPPGRLLEVPSSQPAEVPPVGGKPKTNEKPVCPKKPNKIQPKKLLPKRR